MSATATPAVTVTPTPSSDELKAFCIELKEWKTMNNVAVGVILSSISNEVEHIIDPEESAKDMYNKLKAKILKQYKNQTHLQEIQRHPNIGQF